MSELVIAGDVDSALTHLAAAGLAEILVDAGVRGVAWHWRGWEWPEAVVESDAEPGEVAEHVLAHARRHAAADAWPQAEHPFAPPKARPGLLSPRVSVPRDVSQWRQYEALRRRTLDQVVSTRALDHRFIAALGRPAYWRFEDRKQRPDDGATRWEMASRLGGQHFVGRLGPLAEFVSQRSAHALLDGLCGRTVVDEAGSAKGGVRTSMGLARPGAVDNALAWCGLWGLAATATWWHPTRVAATTAVAPQHKTHPSWAALPVFAAPVTSAGYRNVLRSEVWQRLTGMVPPGTHRPPAAALADCEWLAARNVQSVVSFPFELDVSSNTPERYLLPGEWLALGAARGYR